MDNTFQLSNLIIIFNSPALPVIGFVSSTYSLKWTWNFFELNIFLIRKEHVPQLEGSHCLNREVACSSHIKMLLNDWAIDTNCFSFWIFDWYQYGFLPKHENSSVLLTCFRWNPLEGYYELDIVHKYLIQSFEILLLMQMVDSKFKDLLDHSEILLKKKWLFGMLDDFITKQLPHNVTWGISLVYALEHKGDRALTATQGENRSW